MSFTQSVLKGSFTLLLMRLFLRGAGLVSMLVLARLLSTEDFGLVAIASTAVFLFDVLSETGAIQYVIQKDEIDDDDLNTVWSLNFLLKIVVWVVFVIAVPFISTYFEAPQLNNALYAISLVLPISGLYNPGMYLHQKEFNFKPQFKLVVTDKAINFIVVIALALILQNYWAMVIGVLISYTIKLILTYKLHDFRPSWSLKKISHQWDFSKWILLKGILGYVRAEFDTFMVTKSFGLGAIGGYNMMKGLSAIPAQDIIMPATQPLLSSFSKVKNDKDRLAYQVTLSLFIICLAIFPVASFLALYHELIVSVLLGQKWLEYSKVLGIMSILLFTFSFVSIFQHALTAVGKIKIIFLYDLFSLISIVGILLVVNFDDLVEFTMLRSLLAIFAIMIYTIVAMKIFAISIFYTFKMVLPIIIACVISSYLTQLLTTEFPVNELVSFFLTPCLFFIIYLVCTFFFYSKYKSYNEISHVESLIKSAYTSLTKKLNLK